MRFLILLLIIFFKSTLPLLAQSSPTQAVDSVKQNVQKKVEEKLNQINGTAPIITSLVGKIIEVDTTKLQVRLEIPNQEQPITINIFPENKPKVITTKKVNQNIANLKKDKYLSIIGTVSPDNQNTIEAKVVIILDSNPFLQLENEKIALATVTDISTTSQVITLKDTDQNTYQVQKSTKTSKLKKTDQIYTFLKLDTKSKNWQVIKLEVKK